MFKEVKAFHTVAKLTTLGKTDATIRGIGSIASKKLLDEIHRRAFITTDGTA